MSRHTEGPWKLGHLTIRSGHKLDKGSIIAVVSTDGVDRFCAEANTRLIAAAPDLLEACQLAVKSWFSGEVSEIHMGITLKAAIAKATGEEE